MLDTLRFITLSLLLASVAVACSKAYTPSHRPVVVEAIPTIWQAPSLDDKAGWCLGERECRALAEAVVHEARGERLIGQYAVAYVILQRVGDRRWPDSVTGVVNYRCHFSYKCESPQQGIRNKDWREARIVAYDVLQGVVQNPVPGADHYYNPKTVTRTPHWAKVYTYVMDIGNHRFYGSRL